MLRDLLERIRPTGIFIALCIFILLSFFAIGQEGEGADEADTVQTFPDETLGSIDLERVIENAETEGSNDNMVEEVSLNEFDEEGSEDIYIPLEEIMNDSEISLNETEKNKVTLENTTNESTLSPTAYTSEESTEINLEKQEFEYLDIDNISSGEILNETLNMEIAEDETRQQAISYSYFEYLDGNKKIYEFRAEKGKSEEIDDIVYNLNRMEVVVRSEEQWRKEIILDSEKHVDDSFITYEDVEEFSGLTEEDISLQYLDEEVKFIDFETYDTNNNGLIDRISWIVPHLSTLTFEIIIDLNENNIDNQTGLLLNVLEAPNGDINKTDVYFNFSILYYDLNLVSCNFNLMDGQNLVINQNFNNALDYPIMLENGGYSWDLNCSDINNSAISNSTSGQFNINVNYTPIIDFNSNKNNINKGESVSFTINITAIANSNVSYIIEYGDGNNGANFNNFVRNLFNNVQYAYNNEGNYTARLKTYIDNSLPYEKTITIIVKFNDTEKPSITLVNPADNEMVNGNSLNFSYKASDNANLSNCTLSIYHYNSQLGSLVYSNINTTLTNNQEAKIELTDFDAGNYSWDVGCYDKSSNYREESRDFEVDLFTSLVASGSIENTAEALNESFEGREEIDLLIDSINEFLINQEKYSVEEKEAVQDLGINEDLEFYKKKLLQMRLDLQHNLDYMRSSESREKRRSEIIEEIENMSASIPISLTVISAHEYYKNSLDFDFDEILDAYFHSKGIVIDDRSKRNMAEENARIQKFIVVSANAKQTEIEYKDRTDKITLVKKEIEIKNNSFDSFIEVLPKEIAESSNEIVFMNEYNIIKEDPIFEVKIEDLKENSIIYYVNKIVDAEEVEKTTTLAFKENIPSSKISGISGLVTFVSGGGKSVWFYISWILTLAIFFCIAFFGFKNARIAKWKKDGKVKDVFMLIGETKRIIKKDIEKSRENYRKVKEIYPSLPSNCKKFIYKKIEELRVEIDKKDISALAKEFVSIAKKGASKEALELYEKINKVYKRLPKKYQKRIYDKILPVVKELKK